MEQLAIDGGKPVKTNPFPGWPYSDDREYELVTEVLRSRKWWRMNGNRVEEFEQKFAQMHNAKYCLGLTNGTHAIELALSALGIGAGDEVIIPAFTFISTAVAVIYCNATPVMADVDPGTFCLDPAAFEKAITPRTKAVIPVHMAGHSCDMDSICRIAQKHNLRVIEDAAHAHGAEWKGRKIGTFGDFATFSFQNGKLVTCGEGGAILTNSKELYDQAYLIHGVGRPQGDRVYAHVVLGSNYRMNEVQGAILIAQLERLEDFNIRRERNAAALDRLLANVPGIIPQTRNIEANLNPHYMYMFYYNPEYFNGISRQEFVDCLIAEGIPSFIAYPVISNAAFYKENNFRNHISAHTDGVSDQHVNADKIAEEVIWLPHNTLLGDELDIEEIAEAIKKIQRISTHKNLYF
ncbi:aminotransferase class I/II-fold pyridoxal phosphate-dependent enzyme [Robinsoniella sp. RHS]|uniref:DegT/DnrJ/EryC1/StrS family aminotransferase n=1 Tax=Robinsoniella sp. RHS TaxID=1504536 RepID=UPI00064B572A